MTGNNDLPSVFAAQALANDDIAVLQMGSPVDDDAHDDWKISPEEARVFSAGAEGAVSHLAREGLVDAARVGITGFSRTGWHVEYSLTHSSFRYAAAIVADSIDNSYVQSAMRAWPVVADSFNGGAPFGPGLKYWLENAPGFSIERIQTPVRLQVLQGRRGYVLSKWEAFGRMRRFKLPIELYLIPGYGTAGHNLQNPRQLLASAGGAADWYNFWLNGKIDPDVRKAEQYHRWRVLVSERDAALSKPRPPLLEWTPSPKLQ